MSKLITASGGYAATIGGTVTVSGSNDVDVISLVDVAGKIDFDGSFNRGGDFIILPNAAKTYSVVRAGSSVALTDADSTITIPVGTTGTKIQFADGELVLKFDSEVLLGAQAVTQTVASVSASLATKAPPPSTTATVGKLIMMQNEPVVIGGNMSVFGTNGKDVVTVANAAGEVSFDGSFNRGGDRIILLDFPEAYAGVLRGSSLALSTGDKKVTIPIGVAGADIEFSNGARSLVYTNSSVYLGNQAISGTSTKLFKFEDNIAFKKVENAFVGSMPLPGSFQVITCVAAIDVNGDGYKDIVFQGFEKVLSDKGSPDIGNVPTPNKISILINHGGKYFAEETSKYLTGNAALSGAARKIEVSDLNGDGKLDLLFASNREDGRAGTPYENNTAYMDILLSTAAGYTIKSFGKEDWYHSAGFATFSGKTYALGAGFLHGSPGRSDMQGGFELSGEGLIETLKLPFQLSPNNFMFFESPGSKDTDSLIQTAAAPNWLGVEAWQLKQGQWSKVGQIDTPGTFIKNVSIKTYNGNMQEGQIYKIDDDYVVTGLGNSITESAKIDIFSDGKLAVVMKLEATVVRNFDEKTTNFVDQSSDTNGIIAGDRLVFFTIEDGVIKKLDIKILGAPKIVNSNLLNVVDFNDDGFQDIVMSPYTTSALPDVYINNRDGTFTHLDLKLSEPMNYRIDGFSVVDDFNNDGIPDMIAMPGNGVDSQDAFAMTKFFYYVGSNNTMI